MIIYLTHSAIKQINFKYNILCQKIKTVFAQVHNEFKNQCYQPPPFFKEHNPFPVSVMLAFIFAYMCNR